MRIAVNTRLFLKGKLEGIGWFSYQTISRMVKNHPEHEFIFFFDRPYDPQFVFAPNVTPVVVQPPARHPILFHLWFDWALPFMFKKYTADVFLSPDGQMSLTTSVPTCLVMHDIAFEHFPEHLPWSHRFYWRKFTRFFVKKATQLVTVSEYSRRDIAQHYHIDPARIDVVYNGAHDAYKPIESWEAREAVKQQYTDGCEYFVFTGALHPRKNVINLLKAFVLFKTRLRTRMKLVIVGRMAWNNKELLEKKETMPYKEDVQWLGYVQVEELSKIMGAAYALVYPSLFEGFGIPIVESLQCGVPAIVSNTTAMPEVGGDAALLCDPNDYNDISDKMELLYKDELLRKKLASATQVQAAKFNWDVSSEKLYKSLMKCVKNKPVVSS